MFIISVNFNNSLQNKGDDVNKKLLFSSVFISCIFLSSCGDNSSIKKVKSYVFDNIDSTRTLGAVMDSRISCLNSKWDNKVENGRNLVSVECNINVKEINSTFEKLNSSRANIIQEKIFKLENNRDELKKSKPVIQEIYETNKSYIAKFKTLHQKLEPIDFYESTQESDEAIQKKERNEIIENQITSLKKELSDKINNLMTQISEQAYYDAKHLNDVLLDQYNPYVDYSNSDSLIARLDSEIMNFNNKLNVDLDKEIQNEQQKLQVFKINPVELDSATSIIYFSDNPSELKPVSYISSEYILKMNGKEFNVKPDIKISDFYNNNELFKLKAQLVQSYMNHTGVSYISNSELSN